MPLGKPCCGRGIGMSFLLLFLLLLLLLEVFIIGASLLDWLLAGILVGEWIGRSDG